MKVRIDEDYGPVYHITEHDESFYSGIVADVPEEVYRRFLKAQSELYESMEPFEGFLDTRAKERREQRKLT